MQRAKRKASTPINPKLAAIQLDTIPCEGNLNVHKAMNWAKRAFDEGAQYVFFHEILTADCTPDPIRYGRSIDSAEVFGFCALAKRYNGYIALGLNEVWRGRPYASMVFAGPQGVVDVYRKSYLYPNPSQRGKEDYDKFLETYVPHEQGYRLERGFLAHGDGTKIIKVGSLRIGCLICADGAQPEAWETFKREPCDLIFWQTNLGNVLTPYDEVGDVRARARKLRTPMVCTNRCGFSYHYFQDGGSCMIANDGSVVVKANEKGKEEMIFANLADLQLVRTQGGAKPRKPHRR